MENRRLGKSAIYVSDICMGTMTFGSQTEEADAHRILDRCLDVGINFFDTAEGYPVPPDIKWVGHTEDIVGRWLKGKNRDAIILATKVSGPSHSWFKSPKRGGMTALDRHNINVAVEDSLRRLQTDYIDLYQTHWPDHGTDYDETMDALDDLVRKGKVRVLGCSNETSYGLMKSLAIEGAKSNIHVNTIFPVAGTRMTEDLMPEGMLELLAPRHVVPASLFLVSMAAPTSTILGAGAGGVHAAHVTMTRGIMLREEDRTPETVAARFEAIIDRTDETVPKSGSEQGMLVMSRQGELKL